MWGALAKWVGPVEIGTVAGLACLTYGLYLLRPWAGFVALGVILLWICLPPRAPFVKG